MDIGLTDNLDILVEDSTVQMQENGETTLIQAFFSDDRIANIGTIQDFDIMQKQRGYWLDIPLSTVWQYDQKRLTNETANDLNETAKDIAKKLVAIGLYERIETSTSIDGGVLTLQIQAYDKKNLVVNRKFAI